MKKLLLLLFTLVAFSYSAILPSYVKIKVVGNGRAIANAQVYMKVYVPGCQEGRSQYVSIGKTNSNGEIVVKKGHPGRHPTLDLHKFWFNAPANCGVWGKAPQTAIEIKVSASGFKTGHERQVTYGNKTRYGDYNYGSPITIQVFLDK